MVIGKLFTIRTEGNLNSNLIFGVFNILAFILNPMLGILICLLFIGTRKNKKQFVNLLIVFLSAFLGLINMTKTLESDLHDYYTFYESAQIYDFVEYLGLFGKEPLYYTINYLSKNLFDFSFSTFIFLVTGFSYFVFLKTINSISRSVKNNLTTSVLLLFSGIFFFELFSLSAHVVRQFLACMIILYFITLRIIENKTNYFLLISAILIHSTSLIFLPFLFIPGLGKKLKWIYLIILIGGVSTLFIIINKYAAFFGNTSIESINYIAGRVSSKELKDAIEPSIIADIFNIICLCSILIRIYIYSEKSQNHLRLLNILLLFIIFVLSVRNQPLLYYRFTMYTYAILLILLPFLLNIFRQRFLSNLASSLILILLIIRFSTKFNNSVWTYLDGYDILTHSSLNYFY